MSFRSFLLLPAIVAGALLLSASQADAYCRQVKANKWRAAISLYAMANVVEKKFGGDWAAYIARWERQIDIAADIHGRGRILILKKGKKRIRLKGDTLLSYVAGMNERVMIAYCLKREVEFELKGDGGDALADPAGDANSGQVLVNRLNCAVCHGVEGELRKAATPRLAGQNKLYLINQIKTFASRHKVAAGVYGLSRREHKEMTKQVKKLERREIADVAAYFENQACSVPATMTPYSTPDDLEFCAACHGAEGHPASPEVPILAGQSPAYLDQQLRKFRLTFGGSKSFKFSNSRHHQFMSAVAGFLTNNDMTRLAEYYGAQSCRRN